MRFDPELQEYVPQHPVVDSTTANIVGSQNPVAQPQELELAAEVASGVRNLSILTYSELMQLEKMDLGHQTNKLVINEMIARDEASRPPDVELPPPPSFDSTPVDSDTTAEEAFKHDHRYKFKNDRREDRRNEFRDDRRE